MSLTFSPLPFILPETQPFWDGLDAGRLMVQRCNDCGQFYFPPAPVCQHCTSKDVTWTEVSGRARLFSFVIAENPWPEWKSPGAMSVALVRLEEGPCLTSTIVDCPQTPSHLKFDMPLRAAFRAFGQDRTMLCFKPRSSTQVEP